MVKFDGKYKNDKNENVTKLLLKGGLPEDLAQIVADKKETLTIKFEGKTFYYKTEGIPSFESKVIVGEEVDERLFDVTGWSTTKIEGNVVKITTISSERKLERTFTFTDSGLVQVLLYKGVKATRYYTRVED